jgi:hypothetical protein
MQEQNVYMYSTSEYMVAVQVFELDISQKCNTLDLIHHAHDVCHHNAHDSVIFIFWRSKYQNI